MTDEKIIIEFRGGSSAYEPDKACSYMIAVDENHSVLYFDDEYIGDAELYAEAICDDKYDLPDIGDYDWDSFDDEIYPILKDEIIKQAEKYGIDVSRLVFEER